MVDHIAVIIAIFNYASASAGGIAPCKPNRNLLGYEGKRGRRTEEQIMTINPNGTEIEFPTPICPITEPHAKHIIPGTWREQCNGVEEIKPDVTDIMEKARALVRENAGDRPHSYALGFAAHTLIAAAAGLPIDRERARLAYAVYRAAAGPAPCPHGERDWTSPFID